MKKYGYKSRILYSTNINIILFITFIIITSSCVSDNIINKKADELIHVLEKYHFQQLNYDKEVSLQIKKLFLYYLDPYSLFFTSDDTKKLLSYSLNLSNSNVEQIDDFYFQTKELYKKKLIQTDKIIDKLLKKPFDYTIDESLSFYRKQQNHTLFIKDLTDRWRKWLKYQMLLHLYYSNKEDESSEADPQLLLKNESKIRARVKKIEKHGIRIFPNDPDKFENFISYLYLNAIANRYDPHTRYLRPDDKQSYKDSFSKFALSFGIYFTRNKMKEIEIERLVPGGPAWKSTRLNKGDIILKIKLPDGKTIDITEYSLSEIDQILRSTESDKIKITVRKVNNEKITVQLIKEKLEVEENIINSFVLSGSKKIGYIYLPGFYTDFEKIDALGCANDLASEIIKLKRDKIEGLILDLRNNNGGSVQEALDIAGIFIDEGPLCITKSRDTRPLLLKDKNRGTIFNGPLILMINKYSVSASEMLAVIFQTYNRAVIIGSSTYGKGTSQVLIPVDKNFDPYSEQRSSENPDMDYTTITVSKFYNLKGKTYQLNGVSPDIKLPEYSESAQYGEKNYNYALASDKIIKKIKYTPYPGLPSSILAKKSRIRIKKDKSFQKIKSLNQQLKKDNKNKIIIPLNIESFIKEINEKINISESLSDIVYRPSLKYTVKNTEYDEEIIQMDKFRKEINNLLITNIHNDIYIEEAYNIMNDFIKISKKKGE